MDRDRIIEKIKKAFNIAKDEHSFDGDIQAAMNAAQKLMAKYHLTEEDLAHEPADDYKAVDEADYSESRSWVGGRTYTWEESLAVFVQDFVGCKVYRAHKGWARNRMGMLLRHPATGQPWEAKAFVFYGISEDAQIASELYDELRQMISTMATLKFNKVYTGDGAVYSEGFVRGLFDHLKQEKEARRIEAKTSSTEMILIERRDDLVKYKQEKAENWLRKDKGVKLGKVGAGQGGNGSYGAYKEGVADGRNTDVSATRMKKIGN